MLDLAASGARVLALRSVEYARNHGVKIHVRSSFNDSEGTWIVERGGHARTGHHLGDRPRHERGEGDDPPRPRPARRRRPHVPPARGCRDQHRHDRPEHLASTASPTSRSRCPRPTSRRAEPILEELSKRDRRRGLLVRERHREGLRRRRRHAHEPGCRGRDLRGARGRRDQHRDHLDLVDPRLLRRARRRDRARRERDPRAAEARGRLLRGRQRRRRRAG